MTPPRTVIVPPTDKTPAEIARSVMNQQSIEKGKPLGILAGSPDRPLVIGDVEIPCYVLEGEHRVLAQRGMATGLGMSETSGGNRFRDFVGSQTIKPYISNDLMLGINKPVLFRNPSGGGLAFGYPAELLVKVCHAVLAARDAGALGKRQEHIAHRCDLLIRALSTVGIIALVDEATGYQEIRDRNSLAVILEKLLSETWHSWTRTFPYDFYKQIFRLKGWGDPTGIKRPSVIGHYTNDLVYQRVAPGILDALKNRNPVLPSGARRRRHHQWFTPDFGHPKLQEHITGVIALMRASSNWSQFKRLLDRAFPKWHEALTLNLEDTED